MDHAKPPSRKEHLLIGVCATLLALSVTIAAQQPATATVQASRTAILGLLTAGADADAAFDRFFDFRAVADATVGGVQAEWSALPETDRRDYAALIRRIVINTYRRELAMTAGMKIDFTGEAPEQGAMLVSAKIHELSMRASIDHSEAYRLVQAAGTWKVVDLVTEDVSLVATLRGSVTRGVRQGGFASVLAALRTRASQE